MIVTLVNAVPDGYLSVTSTLKYTVPANKTARIVHASVFNTSSSNRGFTVHLVPFGGTATADNIVADTQTITAYTGQRIPIMEGRVLSEGDMIYAHASYADRVRLNVVVYEME